ncbi:MAG: hypothetical protein ACI4JC_01195 [Faecalibacterium sp.]
MSQKYEQTEMDLRTNLQIDVDTKVNEAINDAYSMLLNYNPPAVRSRHEAYGIAADNFTRINASVKLIKDAMGTLLGSLSSSYPAVEAVSSLFSRVSVLISASIVMAADMKRTMNDLYESEVQDEPTPMEAAAAESLGFEEVEPTGEKLTENE